MNEHISILQGYIDHLEYMKKNADDFFDREQADKDIEAFKAAIEALKKSETVTEFADRCRECGARYGKLLKQKLCGDCISRQAVLDITWEEPSYTDALNVLTEVRDKVKELPSVNPQSCEDAISRQYLIDIATKDGAYDYVSAQEIANAPSVTPQPKIGHWIEDTNGTYTDNHDTWECSECGHAQILLEGTPKDNDYNYCPNCGAKMVEPQESEGKE